MKIITSILFIFLTLNLLGQNYYVSPTGDDSFSGTSPSTAWKTLDRASSFLFPEGSSLYLTGVLSGSLVINDSDGLNLISRFGDTAIIKTTINTQHGVYIYNKGDIEINGLTILGTGNIVLNEEGNGIYFYSDDNKRHRNISVKNTIVKHFSGTGITTNFIWIDYNQVRAYTGGYDNITFDRCITDSNGYAGIATYGIWPKKNNTNVRITNCEAHYNKGIPGRQPHSGHGILAAGFVGGLIENCKASFNGWQGTNGNIAIWVHDCDSAVIQYCEAWATKSNGADGGGFDLDGGCTNSMIQYCYSHDNDGEGYLAYPYSYESAVYSNGLFNEMRNNTLRYNVSKNDAVKHTSYGGITIGGAITQYDLHIYNNTIISPRSKGGITNVTNYPANTVNRVSGLYIKNNLIISDSVYLTGQVENNVFVTQNFKLAAGSLSSIPTSNKIIPNLNIDSLFTPALGFIGTDYALELPNLPNKDFHGNPTSNLRDVGAVEIQPSPALPVTLLYFMGQQRNGVIELTWKVGVEVDFSHYVVQSSADGYVWSDQYKTGPIGSGIGYCKIPHTESVYFRLKMVDLSGTVKYSKTLRFIYTKGPYTVSIFNMSGQVIYSATRIQNLAVFKNTFRAPTAGIYIFKAIPEEGNPEIEKRFVYSK